MTVTKEKHSALLARMHQYGDYNNCKRILEALGDAGIDGYLAYYISRAGNDEIIVWGEETDNVFRMNPQDMSYSVCKMHGKGKNEYLFPILSDDSSDDSEAILFGGSSIARYIRDEMQVIDIAVAEMDMHKCLTESGYTGRDLYGRPGEGVYGEKWIFGVDFCCFT